MTQFHLQIKGFLHISKYGNNFFDKNAIQNFLRDQYLKQKLENPTSKKF